MEKRSIKVACYRFNPKVDKEPWYKTYEVAAEFGMSVLDVLDYIFDNVDSSLAYYGTCRRGICVGCVIVVNGKQCLACQTLVKGDLKIEPKKGFRVIKDLVVSAEKSAV